MKTFILQDKEQFKQFREAYRVIAKKRENSISDHILYNIIRGYDKAHGFCGFREDGKRYKNKCVSRVPGWTRGYQQLRYQLGWNPTGLRARYGDMLTDDLLQKVLETLEGK
jgi:hypothetical protein